MSDEIKKPVEITDMPLPESELEKVAGGKVSLHDLSFTHNVDKASPVLMQTSATDASTKK